jgi:acetyl/propionyl-CoA carboxylase alpha subunit
MSHQPKPIRKLLIANRGEIAVRVIRAAQEMGVRAVAVFSDADEHQMHVALADEAVSIGASEPAASYLDTAKIIEVARQTGADAIHPGYGFLSERAEFSQACAEAGIVFVGPPASAMRKLGSKIEAKQLAVGVGVPVTPGYFEPGATDQELRRATIDIGLPVMLKASAGGGGRGMRIVRDIEAFDEELSIASSEALKAFGNGEMMVEKLIERPRHIEVQVLADTHGNVACLFERECSIQRRHQKLIEEAPSAIMTGDLWAEMEKAVRALILGAGYHGAGTVEFMFDEASGQFFFLEVNARLQVEHPVTEMITGLDLVKWQLRVASGELLDLPDGISRGDRLAITGHAIEARIVAENPAAGFIPSVGKILAWAEPKRPGVRVDTGYGPGAEIPRFYDSLIAKVIAHGETRDQAIQKLESALLDFHILGVKTNIAYILDVIRHPDFRAGHFDTGFLGREFADWQPDPAIPEELAAIAECATVEVVSAGGSAASNGAWDLADGFRISRS